jgi:hypothetical protein
VRIDGSLRVERDISNLSLSAAGVFVSGRPGSGWLVWLLENGMPVDVLRKNESDSAQLADAVRPQQQTPMPKIELNRNKSLELLVGIRKEINQNPHSRWLSWNHCYHFFRRADAVERKRDAALHLGFYLASWGMFRNSELLKKNHLFYEPLVEIFASQDIGILGKIPTTDQCVRSHIKMIRDLSKEIQRHLEGGQVSATTTLISKILLGAAAAIPAIDAQARRALKNIGLPISSTQGLPDEADLTRLFTLVRDHKDLLEEGAQLLSERGFVDYPPMKILDMILWVEGDQSGAPSDVSD